MDHKPSIATRKGRREFSPALIHVKLNGLPACPYPPQGIENDQQLNKSSLTTDDQNCTGQEKGIDRNNVSKDAQDGNLLLTSTASRGTIFYC